MNVSSPSKLFNLYMVRGIPLVKDRNIFVHQRKKAGILCVLFSYYIVIFLYPFKLVLFMEIFWNWNLPSSCIFSSVWKHSLVILSMYVQSKEVDPSFCLLSFFVGFWNIYISRSIRSDRIIKIQWYKHDCMLTISHIANLHFTPLSHDLWCFWCVALFFTCYFNSHDLTMCFV